MSIGYVRKVDTITGKTDYVSCSELFINASKRYHLKNELQNNPNMKLSCCLYR